MTQKHIFFRKQKVLPCEIACVKLLCFWWKNIFALKIVDLNFIFSWKRKYYQSNIALNAFCKIDLIFIQTHFIKWVGWAIGSLELRYWVTQTEVRSHSVWAAESLGLGYWVNLRLDYGATRLGYWVTRAGLRSHSQTGLLSHSLSHLGLGYRVP